jgi:hypothetical protein
MKVVYFIAIGLYAAAICFGIAMTMRYHYFRFRLLGELPTEWSWWRRVWRSSVFNLGDLSSKYATALGQRFAKQADRAQRLFLFAIVVAFALFGGIALLAPHVRQMGAH